LTTPHWVRSTAAHARDQASSIMNDSHQFPGTIYAGNYTLSEQDWAIQDVEVS